MLIRKTLCIYKDGSIVNRVVFQKADEVVGWRAIHFDRSRYLPFCMFDSLERIKSKLSDESFEWHWE